MTKNNKNDKEVIRRSVEIKENIKIIIFILKIKKISISRILSSDIHKKIQIKIFKVNLLSIGKSEEIEPINYTKLSLLKTLIGNPLEKII